MTLRLPPARAATTTVPLQPMAWMPKRISCVLTDFLACREFDRALFGWPYCQVVQRSSVAGEATLKGGAGRGMRGRPCLADGPTMLAALRARQITGDRPSFN